jgi:hypothetical protein
MTDIKIAFVRGHVLGHDLAIFKGRNLHTKMTYAILFDER